MAVSSDIGISYHLRSDFIPTIFQRYRRGMYEITHVFIRNFIRDWALNAKVEANQIAQQKENKLREADAEDKKQVAQAEGQARCVVLKSESEAKANLVLAQPITPELIQWQSVQKWARKLPQVTGENIPLINIKSRQ